MRYLLATVAIFAFALCVVRGADPRVGIHLAHGSPTSNVIESVSPPVVGRGKTTRVTFTGKDLRPGLDVWSSLPKGALTAKPVSSESGRLVFDVTANPDAPVGVCGLRVATRDGLTNAVLFCVEDLPVKESRTSDKPVSLTLPACVWGTFREGTLDRYAITVAAGERVSFEAIANRLGKDADPLITIRDAAGRFVVERDNDAGLYFDFRFEHRFEDAGTYTVEFRDARLRASEHHHYILRMGKFSADRVALPPADAAIPVTVARPFDESRDIALSQATSGPAQLAFLWSPLRANPFQPLDRMLTTGRLQVTPATVPGLLCGTIRKPEQRIAFAFRLEKGQRIFVKGEARALNSPADIEVSCVDRSGREQRRSNEDRATGDATLDFTANAAGEYGLVVRDVLRDGSDAHAFRLTVRSDPFPPTLTAECEGLAIPQGSYQAVPIVVTRTGPPAPIKLSLLGAPAGLKITPTEIPATANAVVCKLEATEAALLGVHTVQIVAECERGTHLQRIPGGSFYALHKVTEFDHFAVRTRPLIDKKLQNVDLIPIALREDQTRLPPALTDRFAVQITPPSPFTFELPESAATLPRYQNVPVPVRTTRVAGFGGSITFEAVGGQLADKSEGRTRVYVEFPQATVSTPNVAGTVVSKILTNTTKSRIDVTATGTHQGRRVSLTRCFDLDVVTAFRFAPEPVKVSLLPGESATAKVFIERLKSFDGPVAVRLNPMQGLEVPEVVTVPKGQAFAEFVVKATPDAQPRKQSWSATASGDVDGFEEEVRGSPVEVEVRKVEAPKK